MAVAANYPITTPYGQVAGYELNSGFHRGEDRAMPLNTPVVVNGVQIGLAGSTGASTGSHLHIGKFTQNGTLLPPQGAGFSFQSAKVITVGFDTTNGNYVRLLGDSYVYIYCHLNKQTCVVGQVLTPGDKDLIVIANTDNEYGRWNKLFTQIRGRTASREEFINAAVGRTWLQAMEILSDSDEANTATTKGDIGAIALRDDWQGQISRLQTALAHLTDELATTTAELATFKVKVDLPPAVTVSSKTISTPPAAAPAKPSFWVSFVAALLNKKI